jgi:hypothetical protein
VAVAAAAAAPGRALLDAQAAAEAERPAVAVAAAAQQNLPLDDGGGGLEVHLLLLLLLARRADAEVEVEVGASGRLGGRRLGFCCCCGGGAGAGLERDGGHGHGVGGDGAVRNGVDAPAQQLPPDVRVPVVLDLVVRPPREPRGDERPPAEGRGNRTGRSFSLVWFGWVAPRQRQATNQPLEQACPRAVHYGTEQSSGGGVAHVLVPEEAVQLDDEVVLVGGEVAALQVGPEVVDPPQPAALAAPQQARRLG